MGISDRGHFGTQGKDVKIRLARVILLCLLFALLAVSSGTAGDRPVFTRDDANPPSGTYARIEQGGQVVRLEVASTPARRRLGLMHRPVLHWDEGMLFVFALPQHVRFTMRNTLISLDMIFLRRCEILAILDHVPPCPADPCPTYGPDAEVDQVIELAAGRAAALGLRTGGCLPVFFLEAS